MAHGLLGLPAGPLSMRSPDIAHPPFALPRNCTFSPSDWAALSGFWHPVAFSSDIGGPKPFAATLLDEKLVIYRAGGRVVAAKDICIHRGVQQLRKGRGRGGRLCLPRIPLRGGRPMHEDPRSARPGDTEEAVPSNGALRGALWRHLGLPRARAEATPSRLARVDRSGPQADEALGGHMEMLRCAARRKLQRPCPSFLRARGHIRKAERPEVPKCEVEVGPTGIRSIEDFGRKGPVEHIHYTYDLTFPFYTRLRICFGTGRNFVAYNLPSPVSARETNVLFRMTRDFDLDKPEDSTIALKPGGLRGQAVCRPSGPKGSRRPLGGVSHSGGPLLDLLSRGPEGSRPREDSRPRRGKPPRSSVRRTPEGWAPGRRWVIGQIPAIMK